MSRRSVTVGPRKTWSSAVPIGLSAMLSLGVATSLGGQVPCRAPLSLVESLRLGSIDGPDAFTLVSDVTVGREGEIYVAQSTVPSISVFSADGRPLRTIGRAGQGPGEFQLGASRVGWMGDTLWAADSWKTVFFNSDGSYVRQVDFQRVYRPAEGSLYYAGAPLADGTFLPFRGRVGSTMEKWYLTDPMPIIRMTADGEVLDTIGGVSNRLVVRREDGYSRHPLSHWYGDSSLPLRVAPDGRSVVLIGEVDETGPRPSFELLRLGISGDTLLSRKVPYTPKPVTRKDRDWLENAFAERNAGDARMVSEATRRRRIVALREEMGRSLPRSFPPVRRVIPGTDGSFWVLRELDTESLIDHWEVYTAAGDLYGFVDVNDGSGGRRVWEPRLEVFRASLKELWGRQVDDLDVPTLVRYDVSCTTR